MLASAWSWIWSRSSSNPTGPSLQSPHDPTEFSCIPPSILPESSPLGQSHLVKVTMGICTAIHPRFGRCDCTEGSSVGNSDAVVICDSCLHPMSYHEKYRKYIFTFSQVSISLSAGSKLLTPLSKLHVGPVRLKAELKSLLILQDHCTLTYAVVPTLFKNSLSAWINTTSFTSEEPRLPGKQLLRAFCGSTTMIKGNVWSSYLFGLTTTIRIGFCPSCVDWQDTWT